MSESFTKKFGDTFYKFSLMEFDVCLCVGDILIKRILLITNGSVLSLINIFGHDLGQDGTPLWLSNLEAIWRWRLIVGGLVDLGFGSVTSISVAQTSASVCVIKYW